MKLKSRLYYRLSLIALLAAAGCVITGVLFPVINLYPETVARERKDALKLLWLQWVASTVRLDVNIEGELPKQRGLVVSNHVSWLDIILIGQYLPGYFVAKSDISGWPVFGFISKQIGTIFIRRGEKKHITETAEKMAYLLRQNRTIFAFPEGTTTNGDDVLHFHASLFQPALQTGAAIHPVAIQYLGEAKNIAPFIGDDSLLPHLIKMLSLDKIDVRLSFFPPIDSTGKTRHAVSHEARGLILSSITDNIPDAAPERS